MHFLVTVAVLVQAPSSGGASARLGEARAAVVAAEESRGRDVVTDPFALLEHGWIAEKRLAFFGEAAHALDEGQRMLARVELEAAEQAFARAESLYEPHGDLPGVRTLWAEATKWRGVALYELKHRDDALGEFGLAKGLDHATELTEAMVRPEVARAFATAPVALRDEPSDLVGRDRRAPVDVKEMMFLLGVDVVVEVAVGLDAGQLVYAATRRESGCMTDVITAPRADELLRRLEAAPCRAGAEVYVTDAPAIAHPRPVPSLAKTMAGGERRVPAWRKPWLWVGVVGALGVGVVLAASLWPREPTYSATASFGSFAGVR